MTVHPTTASEYHPKTNIVPFTEMVKYLLAWKEESEAERTNGSKRCKPVRGFGRVHETGCAECKNAFQDEYSEDVYMPVCGCHIHEVCEQIGSCCVGRVVKRHSAGVEYPVDDNTRKLLRVSSVCGHAYMTAPPLPYVKGHFEQMRIQFSQYPLVYPRKLLALFVACFLKPNNN
jgi:hypothetical protein